MNSELCCDCPLTRLPHLFFSPFSFAIVCFSLRCYMVFRSVELAKKFRAGLESHRFVDAKYGIEFSARVERAPLQRMPVPCMKWKLKKYVKTNRSCLPYLSIRVFLGVSLCPSVSLSMFTCVFLCPSVPLYVPLCSHYLSLSS